MYPKLGSTLFAPKSEREPVYFIASLFLVFRRSPIGQVPLNNLVPADAVVNSNRHK